MRTASLFLAGMILAVLVPSASAQGPAAGTPADYWLDERGVVLHFESLREHEGAPYAKADMAYWFLGMRPVGGRMVHHHMLSLTYPEEGGMGTIHTMGTFQEVDDERSMSVALQFYGEPIREQTPYLELVAPLVPGQAWRFETELPVADPGIENEVAFRFRSVLVDTGLTIAVPAGEFSGCLRVVEVGHSTGSVTRAFGPHAGRSVQVVYELERIWAPGLGTIREVSSQATRTLRKPVEDLDTWTYESSLVRIEGR